MNPSVNHFFWAASSVKAEEYELWSWRFFEAGAASVEELTNENGLTHFRLVLPDEESLKAFTSQFPELKFEITQEEVQDWDTSWRDQQEPLQVSDDLVVVPPWLNEKFDQNNPGFSGVKLQIEAKQAFGTGHHETTSLMAKLMDKHYATSQGATLDIGTGTGILAMYAYCKRASSLTVTEIDPVCLPCIEENFDLNGLPQPNGILGFLDTLAGENHYGSILINMIRSEVWPLREDIIRLLEDGGEIYISGQLADEKHYVLDWFNEAGFTLIDEIQDGDWWAAMGKISKA